MTCTHTHKDAPDNSHCEDCTEFNLSEKIIIHKGFGIGEHFSKSDVKEFIRRLKEKAMNAQDYDVLINAIDLLAGDDLK